MRILRYHTGGSDKEDGFGTVVIPTNLPIDGNLSKNTAGAAVVPAVKLYDQKDGRVFFTVCVTGIPQEKYRTDFSCVPYATAGENTVYGEVSDALSVFDVAQLIYSSEDAEEGLKEYIYDNILSVISPDVYPAE